MSRIPAAILVAAWLGTSVSLAAEDTDRLFDALRLDDVVDVMREEGIAAGDDLEADLFPGSGGLLWDEAVRDIYDRSEMLEAVRARFDDAVQAGSIPVLVEFFESETGQRLVELEIAARRAMIDEAVEAATEESARDAPQARRDLIDAFIAANDLVEQNVTGALNSNYAFYRGLLDEEAPVGPLSEDQVIADVYASEPQVRADTEAWLDGYLTLAYAPVDDEALSRYLEISESRAGQDLNTAIFAAFDELYDGISYELGRAAARFMRGQDL
ncbi:hypothetical protein SAMN04488020_1015 [Palleronia marisminoris]|uniref:DUF2059 domain-containing protein n=1 Tax=Palleronia marisminoris TaxID=315423 RepID=A0A1Y5R689_9RHOB|nr:DUF2059 domain-containing protein [Palleronia marisminoris]SFG05051.1 hypothetical protein SAMN04488020_1015 [Palleronia marisminoris]SLN10177.1 hypothetical protein PAM7066_00005 [Palleronia marisminoris]